MSAQDWNLRFLKSPQQTTIIEFESAALSAFRSIWDKDCSKLIEENKSK